MSWGGGSLFYEFRSISMYIYLNHSGVFGFPVIATRIFNDFVVGNKGGSVIEPRTSLSFSFPSIQERL